MARKIQYTFKGETKLINFAFDRFNDAHEAAAAAEGIDITRFLAMEQQLQMSTRDKKAWRSYRDGEFQKMGFGDIRLVKDEEGA
ncbi:DUF2960 domain-containing protein [Saccharobesus litoralis]|uniref:DUF2960 domain-containing protein n=1 Tax=Saccharobesus litoralis TaxID=2172099 RepID=A0A2S0VXK1_9ALTE|nr:DUF2960 family protein [Saccharobesus litoralis]AWB68905.1 DUF2960 domain-containing protein [Saccharobesus litoralis]